MIFRSDYNTPALDLSEFQVIPYYNSSVNNFSQELPSEFEPVVTNPTTVEGAVNSNVELEITPIEETVTSEPIAIENINTDATIEEAIIDENFDFDIYDKQEVKIVSKRENGEIYTFAKFNIETDGGDIIAQKFTNKNGEYTGKISTLSQQKLYIRFTSTGLSSERIALN